MARPAEVLYQRGGEGIIIFAGQRTPALAIRADRLKGLHDLAKAIATGVKRGTVTSKQFRAQVQDLHLEIASMMLHVQDAALQRDAPLDRKLRISGADFIDLDQGAGAGH
jgi:hypothetical protein